MGRPLNKLFRFYGPFRGLCSQPAAERLGPQWAQDLNNVMTRSGAIEKRPGWAKINSVATFGVTQYDDNFNRDNAADVGTDWDFSTSYSPRIWFSELQNSSAAVGKTTECIYKSQIGSENYGVEIFAGIPFDPEWPPGSTDKKTWEVWSRQDALSASRTHYAASAVYTRATRGGSNAYLCTLSLNRVVAGAATELSSTSSTYLLGNPIIRLEATGAGATVTLTASLKTGNLNLQATASDTHADRIVAEGYGGIKLGRTGSYAQLADNFRMDALGANPTSVTGMYNFKTAAQTNYLFCKGASRISYLSGSQFKLIADVTTTSVPSFVGAMGKVYMANGGTEYVTKISYTSTTNFESLTTHYRAGLIAPTTAAVLVDEPSGGTEMDAEWAYRYTLLSELHGLESNPSPVSTTEALANDRVLLTLTSPANPDVSHYKLYRRLATAGLEGEVFILHSISPISAGVVMTDETDTTAFEQELQTDHDPPPAGVSIICYRNGRMFYTGVATDPTKLYWSTDSIADAATQEKSGTGHVEYVPATNYAYVGRDDGEPIKALFVMGSLLVVFKARSIWTLSGFEPLTWTFRKIVFDVGAIGHRTVVSINGMLYFASERGVYRFNGTTAEPLSIAIEPTYFALATARMDTWSAADDPRRGLYLLACESATAPGQRNDTILALNYRQPPEVTALGAFWTWYHWDIPVQAFAQEVDSNGAVKVHMGRHDGFVGTLGGPSNSTETDDGGGIDWFWKGFKTALGVDSRLKRLFYEHVAYQQQDAGSLRAGYLLDDDTSATWRTCSMTSAVIGRKVINRRARYFAPYIAAVNATVASKVTGFEIDGKVLGH